MLRPPSLRHALRAAARAGLVVTATFLLALGLVSYVGLDPAGTSVAAAATARPPDPSEPLVVRMSSITPDYIPQHGPIVIRGTLTNASDQVWTSINVHGFIGSTPITTTAELAAAVKTPVDADVGHRITANGTFDHIDSLQPGQTVPFTVQLPRSTLPVSAPGVYWFGVHALGANPEGFTGNAAGRDRTFLALIPKSVTSSGAAEQLALVAPLRGGVVRATDGSILDTAQWARSLRSGPLHRALAWGQAAQAHPLSWLVDPAVIDAVRQLAAGNPPRSISSGHRAGGPSGGPSASASPSSSASTSDASGPLGTTVGPATIRAAQQWLTSLRQVLTANPGQTFGLPYGDLQVSSALRYDAPLLAEGVRRTGQTLRPWHIPLTQAVSPPSGRMTGADVAALPRATEVMLDDTGYAGPAPAAVRVHGRTVVLASTGAAEGGPGPVDPLSSLALRQRILAEAAIRLLDQQQPLVVDLPAGLGRPRTSFFTGLDVPWLRQTSVDDAIAGGATPAPGTRLLLPALGIKQFGPRLYAAARRTLDDARVLQSVLKGNHSVRREIFTEVAGNASYTAADDRIGSLARMSSTSSWVSDNLQGVQLAAPGSVTLASTSGRFSVIVSNTLDAPVTVRVRAVSDPALKITGGDAIPLSPHTQTSVLLKASTQVPGVHNVTLELTNLAGAPLGSRDEFPVRAEQVSVLIWVIIGAGLVMLLTAIAVRLTRRFLRRGAA